MIKINYKAIHSLQPRNTNKRIEEEIVALIFFIQNKMHLNNKIKLLVNKIIKIVSKVCDMLI